MRPSGASNRRWSALGTRLVDVAVAGYVTVCTDVLLQLGLVRTLLGLSDVTAQFSRLVRDVGLQLQSARPEAALTIILAFGAWFWTWKHSNRSLPVAGVLLCTVMLAAIGRRSVLTALDWTTGDPPQFVEVGDWARRSTPVTAKFIFFEVDATSSQPRSWQTVSQRGAAELYYTFQKAYSPDRRLLEIDALVNELHGLPTVDLSGGLPQFSTTDLHRRYQAFHLADFLRVGRLSGASFVVLPAYRPLDLPEAFRNHLFVAYRLPVEVGGRQLLVQAIGPGGVTVSWTAEPGSLPIQMFVDFRHPGTHALAGRACCATIEGCKGEHTVLVPTNLAPGTYLPMVGRVGDTNEVAASEYLVIK